MLSYQHGYHAGNFADVHKHTALCLLLRTLQNERRIVTYFDTHGGRGLYDLGADQAQKTGEWRDGIGRLSAYQPLSDGLSLFLKTLSEMGPQTYPGSPKLIQHFMADNHRAHCFELHPQEHDALSACFADDARMNIYFKDGPEQIYDYLPQRTAPGLILMDPSYEVKEEYQLIGQLGRKVSKRWPAGIVMIWYPILEEGRHETLKAALPGMDFYEMDAPFDTQRMRATGLGVLNAPSDFETTFRQAVDEIQTALTLKGDL